MKIIRYDERVVHGGNSQFQIYHSGLDFAQQPENLVVRLVDDPSPPLNDAASDVDVRVEMKFSKIVERNREPLKRVVQARKGTLGFLPPFQTPKLPVVPLELPFRQPIHLVLLFHQYSIHLRVNYAHVLESLVEVILRDSQLRSHPLHDVGRVARVVHPPRGGQPGAARVMKPGLYVTGVRHELQVVRGRSRRRVQPRSQEEGETRKSNRLCH